MTLLTKREAAAYLRVSLSTVERLMRDRELRFYKPAGRVRFNTADLDAYLRASEVRPMVVQITRQR